MAMLTHDLNRPFHPTEKQLQIRSVTAIAHLVMIKRVCFGVLTVLLAGSDHRHTTRTGPPPAACDTVCAVLHGKAEAASGVLHGPASHVQPEQRLVEIAQAFALGDQGLGVALPLQSE